MFRSISFVVLACALAMSARAMSVAPGPGMETEMPLDMPRKCMTRPLVTSVNCACYLLATRQIKSAETSSSLRECKAIFGTNREIFKLGNSCRRFINANMEIMVDVLSESITRYARACVDPDAVPVVFSLPPPMEMPSPSIELLSRMCMTRRFRNIISCACYLEFTQQITNADRRSLMRCRDIIGPNKFLVKGATKCRKFIGGKSGFIMIRRLQFQANVYMMRCINPDAPEVMLEVPQ